jgi:hypothetical protein
MHATLRRFARAALASAFFALAGPATAGSIALDAWLEFGFTDPGVDATGCDPDDPLGPFCIASSGTPTAFLDAPPWTFTGAATLTVVDAFVAGDRFEVFDFGASLGATSLPVGSGDCGDDPLPCLADPNISRGQFQLASGGHALTIRPLLAPGGGGAGYLLLHAPEPTTWLLLAVGMVALVGARRKSQRSAENRP